MLQFLLLAVSTIILGVLANKLYFCGAICKSENRLDRKIVIITGATSGIGLATAIELAKRGARVILAGLNDTNTKELILSIQVASNNKNVEFHELDLSDFSSVRIFAEKMNNNLNRLDILINNAGVFGLPFTTTGDGVEKQFAVNYFGPFLLTYLLLELLKKGSQSRIINVSSFGHFAAANNWDHINSGDNYNFFYSYCQTKLALVIFTIELAKRLERHGIAVVSVNPGAVRTNILSNTKNSISCLTPLMILSVYPIYWMLTKSPFEGAQTSIYCAVDEKLAKYTGCYFSDCKLASVSKQALCEDANQKLWKLSEKICRIIF